MSQKNTRHRRVSKSSSRTPRDSVSAPAVEQHSLDSKTSAGTKSTRLSRSTTNNCIHLSTSLRSPSLSKGDDKKTKKKVSKRRSKKTRNLKLKGCANYNGYGKSSEVISDSKMTSLLDPYKDLQQTPNKPIPPSDAAPPLTTVSQDRLCADEPAFKERGSKISTNSVSMSQIGGGDHVPSPVPVSETVWNRVRKRLAGGDGTCLTVTEGDGPCSTVTQDDGSGSTFTEGNGPCSTSGVDVSCSTSRADRSCSTECSEEMPTTAFDEDDDDDEEVDEGGLPQAVRSLDYHVENGPTPREIARERQRACMEQIAKAVSPEAMVEHLKSQGFFNHDYSNHSRKSSRKHRRLRAKENLMIVLRTT